MKDKKELEKFTDSLRMESIRNGLKKIKSGIVGPKDLEMTETSEKDIIEKYMKVVVISHTEKGRKICEKVKVTLDTDIINEYLKELDREQKPKRELKKLQNKIKWDLIKELKSCEWCF